MDRNSIYRELFNRVVHGVYGPGVWLREDALAAEFGVSRTPIREVLFQLAQDGLAEGLPNRGFRSVGFTVDDLEEAYEIRRALEVVAVERATASISIASLHGIRARIESIAGTDDPIEHATLDSELHRLIADASHSRRLITMLSSLYRIMQSFRELGFASSTVRDPAAAEHIELIDALAARDAPTATRILDKHIRLSKARVLKQVLEKPIASSTRLQ